jgi:hypothetical protein
MVGNGDKDPKRRINGVFDSAHGFKSLGAIEGGDFNTASGAFSGPDCTNCNRSIFTGFFSGRGVTGDDNIFVGNNDQTPSYLEDATGTVVVGNNCIVGNNSNWLVGCDGHGNRKFSFDANGALTLPAYGTGDMLAIRDGQIFPLEFEQLPKAMELMDRVHALEDRLAALEGR